MITLPRDVVIDLASEGSARQRRVNLDPYARSAIRQDGY